MRKKFSFIFPLSSANSVARGKEGRCFDDLADLVVTGVAQVSDRRILDNINDRCGVEIESISYKGTEVSALLGLLGQLDQVFEACMRHLEQIINAPGIVFEQARLVPYTAKIVSLPLKRRIGKII